VLNGGGPTTGLPTAGLMDGYELLRCGVLSTPRSAAGRGLTILMSQGLAAWMVACSQSEVSAAAPVERPRGGGASGVAHEVVEVLTAMVLSTVEVR
jgi:hypothetical protein